MPTFLKTTIMTAAIMGMSGIAQNSFAADRLEIHDFIGTIHWSNGPLSAVIEKNGGKTQVLDVNGLTIDGQVKDIDGSDCQSSYGRFNLDLFGKEKQGHFGGYKKLDDLPILKITVPEQTKLTLRDVVVFTHGNPKIGVADIELRHCGNVTLGNVDGQFALDSRGSADVTVGTTGALVVNMSGAGDLSGGDSQDVLIKANGAGDLELGDLTSLEISTHGSGDVEINDVSGAVAISSHGSGDVELGQINGNLSYKSQGSGGLDVDSVNGNELKLETRGSGDVEIGDGKITRLIAISTGSGSIEFEGQARTADLRSSGSGDVLVDRVTGSADVRSSGSGEVKVEERG